MFLLNYNFHCLIPLQYSHLRVQEGKVAHRHHVRAATEPYTQVGFTSKEVHMLVQDVVKAVAVQATAAVAKVKFNLAILALEQTCKS